MDVKLLCDLPALVSPLDGDPDDLDDWVERVIPAGSIVSTIEFSTADDETNTAGVACGETTLDDREFLVDFGGSPLEWWGEPPDGTGWFEVHDLLSPTARAYRAKWDDGPHWRAKGW